MDSGNGLISTGGKPLPEPMMTQSTDAYITVTSNEGHDFSNHQKFESFVQQLVQNDNKHNIEDSQFWPIVRGIHGGLHYSHNKDQ